MRRRTIDHIKYYWGRLLEILQAILLRLITASSFLMLFFYFGYIVYFSIVCYDISRVITGCIALCVMIHLNKSL